MSQYRRPEPLSQRVLKLQPLHHPHVRHVRIRYRRPGSVYVESSLRQWPIKTFVAFAGGDDDVRLAVHEAAGLVGADFANGEGGGVGGG